MEKFSQTYFNQQTTRVIKNLNRITSQGDVKAGRIVPGDSSIAINDGRRIDATVMFLDISEFSSRPAWTPNEQTIVLRILSLFFGEMGHVIEDHGGTIEKNTGDGLMAYFVQNTADSITTQHRALNAALTMFYAADNLINPLIAQSGFEDLSFRVCMDHGPITVARLGAARRFNGIVAIGTTANIASKMLAVADPNTILVGRKFAEGLPTSFIDKFLKMKTTETGWFSRETNQPYSYWEYSGRWKGPTG